MSMQDQSKDSSSKDNSGSSSSGENSSSGGGIQDIGVKAQQKTGEIIDQAQDKVGEVAGKVKEQASSQISTQKDRAAEGLGNVAEAIRQTGEQLRKNEQAAPVAQYTDQLAQGVEMVSNYLQNNSLSNIVSEVERFARREPALFLGGALTIGLLAGRFLRSSGSNGTQSQSSTTALARVPDATTYGGTGTYGSKSTGYSTPLSSNKEPSYGSYDLPGSVGSGGTFTESLTDSYSDGSDVYSGVTTPDISDLELDSSSTPTLTESSGYSSNYPIDSYGNSGRQSYGSQGSKTGGESGGPTGIV